MRLPKVELRFCYYLNPIRHPYGLRTKSNSSTRTESPSWLDPNLSLSLIFQHSQLMLQKCPLTKYIFHIHHTLGEENRVWTLEEEHLDSRSWLHHWHKIFLCVIKMYFEERAIITDWWIVKGASEKMSHKKGQGFWPEMWEGPRHCGA